MDLKDNRHLNRILPRNNMFTYSIETEIKYGLMVTDTGKYIYCSTV